MLPSNFERGMNDAMALSRGGSGWNCDAITNILIDVRSYNAHSARENAANVQAQSFNDVVFDMSCMVMHLVLGCNLLHMVSQAVILICWYEPDLFVLNSRRCLFISIDSVSPEAKWLERLWDLTYLCAPIRGKMESHTHTYATCNQAVLDPRMSRFVRLKRPYAMWPRTAQIDCIACILESD